MATQKQLPWGAKTGIEAAAIEKSYGTAPTEPAAMRRHMQSAGEQARDEIRRETRGKAPAAYAKGGAVKGWGKARGARAAKVK